MSLVEIAHQAALSRRSLRWLENRTGQIVTQRDIHRGPLGAHLNRGPAGIRRDSILASALCAELEALGAIESAPEPLGKHVGRPKSPAYKVLAAQPVSKVKLIEAENDKVVAARDRLADWIEQNVPDARVSRSDGLVIR